MPRRPTGTLHPTLFAGDEALSAGFTTRHGGVSKAPFDTLNLGLNTDDDPECVVENRRRMAEAAGFEPDALVIAGQVHGAEMLHADAPGLYPGYDAVVTTTPGLLLCITAADCAAVLLADTGAGIVGACHAGWRGTVARVAAHTVAAMVARGAEAARIRAYISPCISAANFEVGEEVAARFDDAHVYRRPDWSRPHVDLKSALVAQLTAAGLAPEAIEVAPECTFAGTRNFFSHRAEQGRTGRMMGFIGLRS